MITGSVVWSPSCTGDRLINGHAVAQGLMAEMEVEEAPPPEPFGPLAVAEPVLPPPLDSQLRELELRSYQQCALQRARERNVIMVGATGIGKSTSRLCVSRYFLFNQQQCFLRPGKTLVAIKLLQELDVSDKR